MRAYDPIAVENVRKIDAPRRSTRQLVFCAEAYEALDGADALLLVTEWKQFRNPDFEHQEEAGPPRDLRRAQPGDDPKEIEDLGFEYYGIGRGLSAWQAGESGAEKAA